MGRKWVKNLIGIVMYYFPDPPFFHVYELATAPWNCGICWADLMVTQFVGYTRIHTNSSNLEVYWTCWVLSLSASTSILSIMLVALRSHLIKRDITSVTLLAFLSIFIVRLFLHNHNYTNKRSNRIKKL
jgi:hypothetical protein